MYSTSIPAPADPFSKQPGVWAGAHAADNRFSWMDIQSIANALQKATVRESTPTSNHADATDSVAARLPLLIERALPQPARPGEYPLTRPPTAFAVPHVTPQTHATYAATWFSLAGLGLLMTRRRLSMRKGSSFSRSRRGTYS